MEIRKTFKFELAHIVRKAWSRRCAKSVHGHSYTVEVFLEGNEYDESGMLIDFGLVKRDIGGLIDRFDHSCMLWDNGSDETNEEIAFFKKHYERVIVADFNSTAEQQARFLFYEIHEILKVNVSRIRIHETTTGYAEYKKEDYLHDTFEYNIEYSEGILNEQEDGIKEEIGLSYTCEQCSKKTDRLYDFGGSMNCEECVPF